MGALINEQSNLALDHVKEFEVVHGAGPLVFGSGVAWRDESPNTGKVSARYDFTSALAMRSTFRTGNRAPSFGQIGNSSTNTNYRSVNGVLPPFEVIAFNVDNPAARALTASDLKPANSINFTVGLVLQPSSESSITLDAYTGATSPVSMDFRKSR